MKAQLTGLAGLAAAVLLAGCGPGTTVAHDPAPTATPPRRDLQPHWPAEGCGTRSGSSIDYASDAAGAETPEEALATYNPEGLAVVRERKRPHREPRWLLVDADHSIVRAVSMFEGENGWLVDGVEECSG
jgi:hypothetical protein